ncbi:hypothetical protein AX774_g6150, partial [Zancudomyces culisetae]
MSNNVSILPNHNPKWEFTLFNRLQNLKLQLARNKENSIPSVDQAADLAATSMETDSNEYVVQRLAPMFLKVYPELEEFMTGLYNDFFRSILSDIKRKEFIDSCPRNEAIVYNPPILTDTGLNQSANKVDSTLYDLQYKLSEITRPFDYFIHQIIQSRGVVDQQVAIYFANVMRQLVSDIASHITQLRVDYMSRALGIQGDTPKILDMNRTCYLNQARWTAFSKRTGRRNQFSDNRSQPNSNPGSRMPVSQGYDKPSTSQNNQSQHQTYQAGSGPSSRSFGQRGRGPRRHRGISNPVSQPATKHGSATVETTTGQQRKPENYRGEDHGALSQKAIYGEGKDTSLESFIGPITKPMDLYQGTEARLQVSEDEDDTVDSLSRLFAHLGRVEEPVQEIKVLTNSKSVPGPSGYDYKHQRDGLECLKNQVPRPKEGGREVSQQGYGLAQKSSIVHWSSSVTLSSSASWSSNAQAPPGTQ